MTAGHEQAIKDVVRRYKTRESIEELMRHHEYTPRQLAELLGMSVHVILHEARAGELKATKIGHHIQSIRREDVLDWLRRRG